MAFLTVTQSSTSFCHIQKPAPLSALSITEGLINKQTNLHIRIGHMRVDMPVRLHIVCVVGHALSDTKGNCMSLKGMSTQTDVKEKTRG
jgi:hypothetical protein